MKIKLILSGILFAISSGYGIAQTINSGDWVEMTRSDYEKFVRDSRDLRALKVGYKFLEWENKNQRRKIDSLNSEINELFETFETLKREYEDSKQSAIDQALHLKKLMEGYKQVAYEQSQKALRMQKWRGKYGELLAIKVGPVIIVMAAALVATYFILERFQKAQ